MFSSFGYQTYCVFVAAAGSGKTPVGAAMTGSARSSRSRTFITNPDLELCSWQVFPRTPLLL